MITRKLRTLHGAAIALAIVCCVQSSSASAQFPPPNDDCANAIHIGDGTVTGSTVGATISSNGCGFAGLTPDVWYAYTAVRTGTLAISTCGSSYDTVVSAYPACGSTNELACNDDAPPGAPCGSGTSDSYVTMAVIGGATYVIRVSGFIASIGAFVLDTHTDTGQPYCLGDGVSGTICPCSNMSHAAELAGCRNSSGAAGHLTADGVPDVSNDSVRLTVSGVPTNSTCLFFQGTSQSNNGYGSNLGDGLLCAGGTVTRLRTRTAVNGAATFPLPGEPSLGASGILPASGGRRYYQVWYRNAATFCTSSTFNLSNGSQIIWQP